MPTVPACVGRSERLPSLRALSSEPPLTTRDLQSFAQTFAIQAETLFNGHGYTVGGTPLQLEVDAGALPPGDSPAPDTHQIAVTASSDARSGIAGLGKPGGPALVGEFSLGYIESAPQVGLHEIGHLLGFPDRYQDVLVDAAGHQAPPPPGITFNNDGSIQNPGAYAAYATAHGLDPATIKGKSVPNPGHEHDLMATTKDPTATFEPAALKSLAADAHHCDPPAPKHLVPVFPSLPPEGAPPRTRCIRSWTRPGWSWRCPATDVRSVRRSNARGTVSSRPSRRWSTTRSRQPPRSVRSAARP